MADGIRHGQDRQSEGQRDADQSNAEIDRRDAFGREEFRRQHGAAAAAKVSQNVPKNSARSLFFASLV